MISAQNSIKISKFAAINRNQEQSRMANKGAVY
jgi:hypothetical protein